MPRLSRQLVRESACSWSKRPAISENCLIYPFMRYSTTVVGKDGSKSTHVHSRGVFTELANELRKCGNGKSFYDEDLRKR